MTEHLSNHLARLAFLKSLVCERRDFSALMEALRLCITFHLPLPTWLGETVFHNLDLAYSRRHKNWRRAEARRARMARHLRRHEIVEEALDRRQELGITWDNVFAEASELTGESADTIRASFRRVRRDLKAGKHADWYVGEYRPAGVRKREKKGRFPTRARRANRE